MRLFMMYRIDKRKMLFFYAILEELLNECYFEK